MPDAQGNGYALVLPFDSDDPEFTRGYEVGWADGILQLTLVPPEGAHLRPGAVTFTVHTTNAEMMLRLADRHKLYLKTTEIDETFMEARFSTTPS